MKLKVKGSKLIEKLQAQRERSVAKRAEALAFLEAHSKQHKREAAADATPMGATPIFRKADGGPRYCVYEAQVKGLTAHIDGHLRRLDAAIEVIPPGDEVSLSLRKYVNSYVESPYDAVTFPSPEMPDDAGGLAMQATVKLN